LARMLSLVLDADVVADRPGRAAVPAATADPALVVPQGPGHPRRALGAHRSLTVDPQQSPAPDPLPRAVSPESTTSWTGSTPAPTNSRDEPRPSCCPRPTATDPIRGALTMSHVVTLVTDDHRVRAQCPCTSLALTLDRPDQQSRLRQLIAERAATYASGPPDLGQAPARCRPDRPEQAQAQPVDPTVAARPGRHRCAGRWAGTRRAPASSPRPSHQVEAAGPTRYNLLP
jgi:hypothetical protein